jgi:hypothetical protein
MWRDQAIAILVGRDIGNMTLAERDVLLGSWWHIDEQDPAFALLPASLQQTLLRTDWPVDPGNQEFDALLRIAIRASYRGVLNAYLTSQIAALGHAEAVFGEAEVMQRCPCCGYHSLFERNAYEICGVCFWEDDGTSELDAISGPNHMTLSEARENCSAYGAMALAFCTKVLPDGRERYAGPRQDAP